jgi:thiol:disulfide interchange protein DsbC
MKYLTLITLFLLHPALSAQTATAVETPEKPATETTTKSPVPSAIKEALAQLLNQEAQKAIVVPSPIKGLYEVTINSEVLYITADGQHLVTGNIIDAKTRKNLTDSKRDTLRAKAIDTVAEKEMVIFSPEQDTQYTVNVFTDVDCGYCAKFHQEVAELNKAGVKIRYLAFPRAGLGSETYNKMVSVWCAKDPQQAITDAKARRHVPTQTCDNPVRKEYELGKSIGISGTPALVLSDGELVPGYVPAAKLVEYLQQKKF